VPAPAVKTYPRAAPASRERAGLLLAAGCATSGAFVPAFAKLTTHALDGSLVAVVTSAFAAVCGLALLAGRRELHRLWERRTAPRLAAIGALGTALTFLLFFEGAKRTSAVEVVLCLQAEPLYSLVLARIFLGHPLAPRRLAAAAGIALGIALAVETRTPSGWLGVGLLLATPLGWQFSHLIALRGLPGVAPRTFASARYVFGGLVLAAVWLLRGGLAHPPPLAALTQALPALAVQGAVLSFVGTLLWYETIARLDLARATAIVVPSIPLLSLGASFLLVGETASPRQWLGLVLTAAGVLAFVTAPHPPSPPERIPAPTAPIATPEPGAGENA
jgi:drug/metabolite transporter (DMT)-like permease